MEETKTLTAEEIQAKREAARKRKADQRARDKAKGIARENRKPEPMYPAKIKENEKAAKEYIANAGVQNIHVIDTIYELSEQTNQPIFGLKIEPSWTTEILDGEIIFRSDVSALYQFSEFRHKHSFEDFLQYRYKSKTDPMWFGRDVLGKDLHDEPHRKWIEEIFFALTPTLKPGYTQEDIKDFFAKQTPDGIRRLLLLCSRSSYKSSMQVVWALQWVLNAPDCRLMEISAVKSLSKSFIKSFRNYWTVEDPRHPDLFAQLFPEMMIASGEKSDSNIFQCPMAHLGLAQPTMTASSMDSSQTGQRFDIGIYDDSEDDENSATPDLRVKLIEKYDLIQKLCEPYGVTLTIGTPQSADRSEATGDLYAVLLARSEKNNHRYLRFRIDPAWRLKPEFEGTGVYQVEPDMIESLLFPTRLTYDFLMSELANGSEKTFRRQNLCEWTDAEDPGLKLQFERSVLQSHVVHPSLVPQEAVVNASADLAFNFSKYRDTSCYTIFKTEKKLYVLDQIAGHWKDSEKAQKIVELTQKYNINWWFIEKYPTCDRLNEDIMREGQKQGVRVQVKWVDAKNTKDRKFHSIKSIETYLSQGVIKFQSAAYTDDLFNQLENLNGTTAARKSGLDDRADSLAMGVEYFRPRCVDNEEEESEIFKEMEKERRRKEQHDMIFGGTSNYTYYKGQTQAPDDSGASSTQDSGIFRALRTGNLVRDPQKKPLSFSYMRDKPIRK